MFAPEAENKNHLMEEARGCRRVTGEPPAVPQVELKIQRVSLPGFYGEDSNATALWGISGNPS